VPLSAVLLSSAGAASPVDASTGGAALSPAPLLDMLPPLDVLPLLEAPEALPLLEPPDPEPLPEELLLGPPLDVVESPPPSPEPRTALLVPPHAQRRATPPKATNTPSRAMTKPSSPVKPGFPA
jgi:protein TonB